jgi:hypothetical protein
VPGLLTKTVIDQVLYFFEDSEVVKELSVTPLALASHPLLGPILSVPVSAPVKTRALVEPDADAPAAGA